MTIKETLIIGLQSVLVAAVAYGFTYAVLFMGACAGVQ